MAVYHLDGSLKPKDITGVEWIVLAPPLGIVWNEHKKSIGDNPLLLRPAGTSREFSR